MSEYIQRLCNKLASIARTDSIKNIVPEMGARFLSSSRHYQFEIPYGKESLVVILSNGNSARICGDDAVDIFLAEDYGDEFTNKAVANFFEAFAELVAYHKNLTCKKLYSGLDGEFQHFELNSKLSAANAAAEVAKRMAGAKINKDPVVAGALLNRVSESSIDAALMNNVLRIANPNGLRGDVEKQTLRQKLGQYFPATFLTKEERFIKATALLARDAKNKCSAADKIAAFLFRDRGILRRPNWEEILLAPGAHQELSYDLLEVNKSDEAKNIDT